MVAGRPVHRIGKVKCRTDVLRIVRKRDRRGVRHDRHFRQGKSALPSHLTEASAHIPAFAPEPQARANAETQTPRPTQGGRPNTR